MNFRLVVIVLLGVVCSLFSVANVVEKKVEKSPNIILVFVDDMGYGDLGCYGHPTIETPVLDRMAEEGIRFTSFYASAPVCTPSRASLLTGRYSVRHLPSNLGPESTNGLPESEITIADILKKAGYKNMAIGKWHLGHKNQFLPTSRGFDSFYGLPYSNDMMLPWCPNLSESDILELYVDDKPVKVVGYEQDDLTVNYTKEAVEFIHSNKDQPFFLYLAHSMPHLPISTSKEFRGKSKAGLYGDVIQTIDWSVGEILNTLRELKIDDETMVIFTSDNGPWLNLPDRMLQKGVEPWHGGSTGLLRGAKATTYEGGFRVPVIVRWPSHIPAKQVCSEMANTMDLFTTIAGIAGEEIPSDRPIDGHDILPLLKGESSSPTKQFFYLSGKKVHAVRDGEWKLRVANSDNVELYNLDKDPSEKYNQAENHPDIVRELYLDMKRFAEESGANIAKL